MSVAVQINLYNPYGQFQTEIEGFDNLSANRVINDVGSFSLDIPYKYWKYMQRDSRFEIMRAGDGGRNVRFGGTHFFGRKFVRRGVRSPFTVSGPDTNILLKRLIVAYPANDAKAKVAATPADNAIKSLWDNNQVYNGATTPPRGYKLLNRQSLYGETPNIDKNFSWREVLAVAQEMAQSALAAGKYLIFDVQLVNGLFELQTYVNCRGVDRREGVSKTPLILSEDNGTLTNIIRTDDYTDEATAVYVGGQGQQASRLIGFAYDKSRIDASPFNNIEKFFDNTSLTTQPSLDAEAARELVECQPKHLFNADMVDGPGNRLDVHYSFGDFATAYNENEKFSVEINAVGLTFNKADGEKVATRLEGSLWTSN